MSKEDKKTEEVVEEKKVATKNDNDDIFFKEKKFNWFKLIGNIIFWGVFAVFIILAIVAYLNYNKLENDEEPSMYSSMEAYKIDSEGNKAEEGDNVTVYNYYLYKVVEHYNSEGRQVSLKLWFIDDITKD